MDSTNSVWSVAVSSRAKCTLIGYAVDCTREKEREGERYFGEKEKEKTRVTVYVC
jgi:hypothetical protein